MSSPITIREAMPSDVEGIAYVHVESWKTTYRDLMPARVIAQRTIERRTAQWTTAFAMSERTWQLFVAEDETRVVGYAQFGLTRSPELPFTHELFAIYSLQEVHGRGIGKRLVAAGTDWLLSQGASSMILWVLTGNIPAQRFYASIGGTIVAERTEDISGATIPEYAYGWHDLTALQTLLRSKG